MSKSNDYFHIINSIKDIRRTKDTSVLREALLKNIKSKNITMRLSGTRKKRRAP
jgi:hypothetical protein